MKIEAKANCPLNNFEPCKQLECAWFLKIRGTNPNTGEDVDDWGCSRVVPQRDGQGQRIQPADSGSCGA